MPKFSAYMRGEKGIQGDTGQASLLDGIVDGYNNLPDKVNLTEDKNYVYYVKENDGIYLYVYEGGSGEDWQPLGVVTAGFSTTQYASASTKEWFPGVQPDITIVPHDNQQTTGLKSFDFHFNIPESQPAGFSTVSASATNIEFGNQPQVSITTSGNNWEKNFHFNFEIPKGEPAGFSTGMTFAIEALPSTSNATVSVVPNPNSPNNAKEFDFNFGIPTGRPGGFGEISVTTTQVDSTVPAEVSITASGEDYSKNFYFNFKIPQGPKGNPGDALGTYLGINFTTTDIDSNNNIYWNNNILHIKRDDNAKIPIYILNSENNNIASTFELTENEILYYADSPFNGILYLIARSNIPTFKIGKCTTISYEQNPYVEAYYENENNPYEITLDFYLTKGTNQSFDEKANWNDIEGNITDNEDLMNLLASKVNNEDLIDLLASKISNEDLENLNFIQEAPNDGKIYGRKEGNWEEITSQNTEEGSGSPGRGIVSIQKTGELGLTDIYTIFYSDNTTSNFTINNGEQGEEGNGISSIELINQENLIDTYRINYTDGTSTTFNITNGNGGNGASSFDLIDINDYGQMTNQESRYKAYEIDNNLSLRSPKWETFDNLSSIYEPFIYFHDRKGEKIGELSTFHLPNNNIGFQLQSSQKINNYQYRNYFRIGINANGTPFYDLTDPLIFRNVLGATTNEGIWPIELGGTGINASNIAPHAVFIGPNSDQNGSPTFRTLTEDDIPVLSPSKINGSMIVSADSISGILSQDKGGTGATTATKNYVFATPDGENGQGNFRKLVSDDIPNNMPINKIRISYTTEDNITSLTSGWIMLVYEE